MKEPVVRPRRNEDVPRLVEVLAAQQPASGYPLRWPLPFPPEEFVVRPGELAAWVADLDGVVVGHVSTSSAPGDLALLFRRAGLPGPIGMVAGLFVDPAVLGTGIGRALMDTAVAAIRAAGRTPVLDVVPANERAVALYRRSGWRTVGEARPDWLPADRDPVLLMTLPPCG